MPWRSHACVLTLLRLWTGLGVSASAFVAVRLTLVGESGADSPCGSGPCYRVGVRTDDETFSLVVTGTVLTQSRLLAVR